MYDGYRAIAGVYDRLNADIDYGSWSRFIQSCFSKYMTKSPEIVLDLACGTGRMTFALADLGYDMIGVDGSADMLSLAYDRLYDWEPPSPDVGKPLFLQQDMRSFELYGTVDAAVCCLDSMNYMVDDGDLDACLAALQLYIAPEGLLIFDVNTPYKFEHVYGQNAYILEDILPDSPDDAEPFFCGWQNEYRPDTGLCHFYLSLFEPDGKGRYRRSDEEQTERCFTRDQLTAALDRNGFDLCGVFSDFNFSDPSDTTERWYIVAKSRKTLSIQ